MTSTVSYTSPTRDGAPRPFSTSALDCFRQCPELFRTKYVLGLVADRDDDAARDGGSAFHAALEVWFQDQGVDAAHAALVEAWGPEPLFSSGQHEKRPRGLYEALLQVYAEKWPRARDPFQVVRNESWVQGTVRPSLGTPFVWGAVLDRLIEMDGERWIMDTKTTSSYLNDTYFSRYLLSSQLRSYVALELLNGRECAGVYVDAVHVDTRYHKAKPEHCHRWGPHRYQPWQLDEWARDAERTIQQVEWYLTNIGPEERWEQRDGACVSFNRTCIFHARCQVANVVAATLPGYKVEAWVPREQR